MARWTKADSPVRDVACPQCLAPAGEVCRTRTGKWLRPGYEHSKRFYTAYADLLAAAGTAAIPNRKAEGG